MSNVIKKKAVSECYSCSERNGGRGSARMECLKKRKIGNPTAGCSGYNECDCHSCQKYAEEIKRKGIDQWASRVRSTSS